MDAIGASQYELWDINEASLVVTPNNEYYFVELELGEQEVDLRITPAGVIF